MFDRLKLVAAPSILLLTGSQQAIAATASLPTPTKLEATQTLSGEPLSEDELTLLGSYVKHTGSDLTTTISELQDLGTVDGYNKATILSTVAALVNEVEPGSVPDTLSDDSIGKDAAFKRKGYSLIQGGVAGDMFRSDASIGINGIIAFHFGHVGIYDTVNTVIEAGTCGPEPSHRWGVYRTSVSRDCWAKTGVNRAFVSGRRGHGRSSLINNTAIARAREWANLRRPYNINFRHNKDNQGTGPDRAFNCSQLVWSAYLPYVDLDHDPGNPLVKWNEYVMPNEIVNHRQVNKY